jgi:hypothetical protein
MNHLGQDIGGVHAELLECAVLGYAYPGWCDAEDARGLRSRQANGDPQHNDLALAGRELIEQAPQARDQLGGLRELLRSGGGVDPAVEGL